MVWRWIHSYIPPKDKSKHGGDRVAIPAIIDDEDIRRGFARTNAAPSIVAIVTAEEREKNCPPNVKFSAIRPRRLI